MADGPGAEFPMGAAFPAELPADGISRRRFLNLLSASAALAFGTSCSTIDRGKVVPYTKRPAEAHPGVATYYASTFQEGSVTHGVLVKTREGRPIHVEGNPEHPLSSGKTSLRAIADILGLYDPDRLKGPVADGKAVAWSRVDADLARILINARNAGKPVLILTEAVVSPTRRALIEDLRKVLPSLRHAAWEPATSQPEISAMRAAYGEFVQPQIRFDRAEVILSLHADFLGSDGNAPAFIRGFAARRRIMSPADPMNRLWVAEGGMTLTGANADERLAIRPSRTAALVFALARVLHETHGLALPPELRADSLAPFSPGELAQELAIDPAMLTALALDLKRAGRSALVLAGSALPPEAHVACHLLNTMLQVEGHTVDASLAVPGPEILSFAALRDLLKEAARGTFAAAIFWGTNPAYSFPEEGLWKEAAARIPARIRIGLYDDETAHDCGWRLPENHWLEAWGDFAPAADILSLRQPAIGTLHDTRQGEEVLLSGLRALGADVPRTYLEYMKGRWHKDVFAAGGPVPFEAFWNAALHDGVLRLTAKPRPQRSLRAGAVREAIGDATSNRAAGADQGLELVFSPGAAVYDGRYANNGWLNELPDPVTKATWGNPLLLSAEDAARLRLTDNDVAIIGTGTNLQIAHLAEGNRTENNVTLVGTGIRIITAPVVIQPGQAPGVASLALGYGRLTGNVAPGIGVNAFRLIDASAPAPHLLTEVKIAPTQIHRQVPKTQEHHRMQGRDLVRSWTVAEYSRRRRADAGQRDAEQVPSLIPAPEFKEHKWSMVIDLSACVGCSSCVIACQSENNVPVVGPEQVIVGREMQWIRIDRYYEGDARNPSVLHQPILCQHCDNAPCEIVCPVNATTHSPDGLNQMAYNRCVGTRYCSNNCPYKVRRFNFFDYTSMKKEPENLVFNPEVTVRPRGVMEKCTFCIQRIQDVKQRARVEGRQIRDGEIQPACAVACPAQAIVFGDLNDPRSLVAKASRADRGYHLLEELGIRPSVTYLADVSNPAPGKGKA